MRAMRVVVVLFIVGCGAGSRDASQRWPHHRERQEERLKQLEQRVDELQREVETLRSHPPAPAAPQT